MTRTGTTRRESYRLTTVCISLTYQWGLLGDILEFGTKTAFVSPLSTQDSVDASGAYKRDSSLSVNLGVRTWRVAAFSFIECEC